MTMSGREADEKGGANNHGAGNGAASSAASTATSPPAVAGVDESGVVAAGSSEMELFRAGKLGREEFIARTAERATSHLEGRIGEARLEEMRALLRSQLENDPTLTALVSTLEAGH